MQPTQKIPLRLFYRTIDDLIINHQSDAAISRSTYLLQEFPKNLSVYQLLGKALLDKQEFDTAFIVFEKILEIEPDDFVSHIGISLISENSGNPGKALESMRRAYELQPSNESLKNEVKRLQDTSSDGSPEQVRLTRGTLIKMYSRSQLADQTIAEAHLGIQESPNRIDYKIHLAKMLDFSGKNAEAVETCMDIIRTHPYCYAALFILYRNIPATPNSDNSSDYKTRLSELDPYFAFMKPETDCVDNIPDIAIMVEERNESEKPIENFGSFLKNIWEISSLDHVNTTETNTQNEDWASIINDAVSNNTVGAPITDTTYEQVVLPEATVIAPEEVIDSGKQVVVPEDEIVALEEVDFAPEQVEVAPEEEVVAPEVVVEFSVLETQKQPEDITAKDNLLRILKSNSSNTSDKNEVPDWILENNKSDDTFENVTNIEENLSSQDTLSTNFGEDGMTDHDSPVNLELEPFPSQKKDSINWEMEHTEHELENQQASSVVLDDTQKIKISSDDPEKLILQAFNSLDNNDFQFAKQCFSKLIQKNYQLPNIAERLENVCQDNPEQLDLWLILVAIYKKLGLEEKSLAALFKAQNNLSF